MPAISRAVVETVTPDSIAADIGIQPGDEIIAINDQQLHDVIDYQFAIADEFLHIVVRRPDGQEWAAEIEKDYDDDLGIGFSSAVFDEIQRCHNACIFCFVDQMPGEMRPTLYVKDDDYRLSFLYGNFITLTNLTEDDYARIFRLRLSPLFVSVHTTNAALRRQMLRQAKAAGILPALKRLTDGGIDVHTQIVLCPGINDGENLHNTINDLTDLGPGILSVAIVPVGLTKHRHGLAPLRVFTREEAAAVIEEVRPWQQKFRAQYGATRIYLADEFYLAAGEDIPPFDFYDDFPQIENGVGITRMFMEKWAEAVGDIPRKLAKPRKVSIITGMSGARILTPLLDRLAINNLTVQLIPVRNSFFGESVTVSGLLTGKDILAALKNVDIGDALIIPGVALRQGEQVFLDDVTLAEFAGEVPASVSVAYDPAELLEQILGCKGDREDD